MVRHDVLHVERIGFHAHEVVDVAEHALHDAVVVGGGVELRAD